MTRKKSTAKNKTANKKKFPWVLVLIAAAAAVIFPAAGFGFAASQEAHDSFCGSCHTQPESTYLSRSIALQPSDLASFHTTVSTRCIDCHSGKGVTGRIQAELLGASNAFKWYTGTAIQPASLTRPITDIHCLKCHDQVSNEGYVPKNKTLQDLGEAQNGHWHLFLPRWQAQDPKAATCVSCHTGHSTDGDVKILYLNNDHTVAICESCHNALGRD